MNKFLKAIMCTGLCGTMVFAAACQSKGEKTETRPLYLSLGAVDGNFNPFFYTSLTDGQVVSMTQSALITTEVVKNPNGQNEVIPAAGDEYPTLAKDFITTYYDADGNKTADSSEAANGGTTEYEFLIKNGMKFSNGSDITIKDVLFNFYVYLDPSYTGSNTMYSVDIKGLTAYRENDSTLLEGGDAQSYLDEVGADERVTKLIQWSEHDSNANIQTSEIQADWDIVKKLFDEEINTDWTSNSTSWSTTYETNYSFKYTWQAFLFTEGVITVQQNMDGSGRRYNIRVDASGNTLDPDSEEYKMGKNLTTLDPWHEDCNVDVTPGTDVGAWNIIDKIEEATASVVDSNGKITDQAKYDELSKEACLEYLRDTYTGREGIKNIFYMGWATSNNAYDYFVKDEHEKRISSSENPMYYIQGLQTYKTSTWKNNPLGEEYDVFKIVINNVDPAAIWQFGVSIAPLYYYSGSYNGKNYVTSFNGHLNGGKGPGDETTCFGLERSSIGFINDVLKAPAKNGVPKGAGAYMASTEKGAEANKKSEFDANGVINYVRNPYFETMGAKIENAKIKNLRYRVIDEDKIIASLESGEIDYGEPNATPDNYRKVTNSSVLGSEEYRTNGYGYVGINAGKVTDYHVRRVIMGVMDTTKALRYYGQGLATNIYRSISLESWASPDVTTFPDYIYEASDSSNPDEIRAYLLANGYAEGGGRKLYNATTGDYLTYTFTIAGANSDHPAYEMFKSAEEILNDAGFTVTVSTDPSALTKLATGDLQVWAAAWSAGVDPDMYQVWHKDSNATSVLNWGYNVIKKNTMKYPYEWSIITELSEKIEAARSTEDKNTRIELYGECLELVMELSVELPIYQRNDLCVYNKTVINPASLNQKPNCYMGLINNIWEVNYL